MRTAIALFTRDLRVHDNPALAAAVEAAEHVLPVFVLDERLTGSSGSNRLAFLGESLRDLAASLGGLAVRRGDTVAEVTRLARAVGAEAVFLAEDASSFAREREHRLAAQLPLRAFPSTSVAGVDGLRTKTGNSYRVFTPFWNAWRGAPRRAVLAAPRVRLPPGADLGGLPDLGPGESPGRVCGGEQEGRRRMEHFLADGLAGYGERADDLAADATSRLGPYLHFGCLSPNELAQRASGAESFVRQLCWRDFFLQLLAASPSSSTHDLRPRRAPWVDDPVALEAWKLGRTGYPIVDAGLRQLRREGWLPNRARLIAASFLTKTLGIHWRHGARHFSDLLVDGDLASNTGNWQWVAGTGADPRRNRILNPLRQAERFDPRGDYVRRQIPELARVPGRAVHRPWLLDATLEYPSRIVDHGAAAQRFRASV